MLVYYPMLIDILAKVSKLTFVCMVTCNYLCGATTVFFVWVIKNVNENRYLYSWVLGILSQFQSFRSDITYALLMYMVLCYIYTMYTLTDAEQHILGILSSIWHWTTRWRAYYSL